MRLLICMLLPLAAWCAPAGALVKEVPDSLKPLIRTKRADEEIVFGNHQNEARVVKKVDPALKLLNDETVIDKLDDNTHNKDVINIGGDGDAVDAGALFSDDVKAIGGLPGDKEDNNNFLPEDDLMTDADDETSGEMPFDEDTMNGMNYKDYKDYYEYYPNSVYGRYRRNTIQKRAAAPEKPLTADNMEDPESAIINDKNLRHKRDLTTEELAQWLEQGGNIEDGDQGLGSSRYYPEYETEEIQTADPWEKLALEELMQKEYPDMAETNADYPLYPEYVEEEDEVIDDDSETNRELLSLLEYLESEAPAEETREVGSLYPEDAGNMYPEDIKEEWEDLDLEPGVPYEPIIYNGVPGIFIPTDGKESTPMIEKRQYLSLVPGMRKREFQYPYEMEPEGGRWGAFIPPQEEKRNADAYERLYRLAEALNSGNQGYRKK